MIQILTTWEGDWQLIEDYYTDNDLGNPYVALSSVSEMKENTFLIILNEADDFDLLEQKMEEQFDLFTIGSYLMSGEQYIYGNAHRNHQIGKYKDKLKDVIEYDENGEPIGSHRPTEAEAMDIQVNKIFGWGNRDLN